MHSDSKVSIVRVFFAERWGRCVWIRGSDHDHRV